MLTAPGKDPRSNTSGGPGQGNLLLLLKEKGRWMLCCLGRFNLSLLGSLTPLSCGIGCCSGDLNQTSLPDLQIASLVGPPSSSSTTANSSGPASFRSSHAPPPASLLGILFALVRRWGEALSVLQRLQARSIWMSQDSDRAQE
ncbi:mCG1049174 [Mus musculus]|nr:mCG1049174 [Mus musculus]